jgi:hypothetical protein
LILFIEILLGIFFLFDPSFPNFGLNMIKFFNDF